MLVPRMHPHCVHETIGKRRAMEDRHATASENGVSFYGVYDGHGGAEVSSYLATYLHLEVLRRARPERMEEAVVASFREVNQRLRAQNREHGRFDFQGSTAAVLVLWSGHALVASVGDSQVALSRSGRGVKLHRLHKPDEEIRRIHSAGDYVHNGRLNGRLAMSRAFGDFGYRSMSAEPEVKVLRGLSAADEFFVLASDGLWDVASRDDVVRWVRLAQNACKLCVDRALGNRSTDNVTVMVVWNTHRRETRRGRSPAGYALLALAAVLWVGGHRAAAGAAGVLSGWLLVT